MLSYKYLSSLYMQFTIYVTFCIRWLYKLNSIYFFYYVEKITKSISLPNANLYPQCIIFYLTDLFLVTFPWLSILSFHVAVSYSESFYDIGASLFSSYSRTYLKFKAKCTFQTLPDVKIRVDTSFKMTVFSQPAHRKWSKDGYVLLRLQMLPTCFFLPLRTQLSRLWMNVRCIITVHHRS